MQCLFMARHVWLQLRQGSSNPLAGPRNPYKHFALALFFRRHTEHFHFFFNL